MNQGERYMEYLYCLYVQTPLVPASSFEFSLKIVNPEKMSIFINVRVGVWKRYESLPILRRFLDDKVNIPSKPDFQRVEIGYIIPGYGLKGKKIWLHTDADLQVMYETLQGKKSIQLGAYTHVTTKAQNKSGSVGSISLNIDGSNPSEVDQIYEQLREKHKKNHMYDEERLRMWAYLINMGKHSSLDVPPDKPFWRGRKRPATEDEKQGTTKVRVVSSSSPRSKVSMRTQLIDQLEKWKKLHTDGIIDDSEYKELRESILTDIKNL